MDVTVVVATYGDQHWRDLAHNRAIPSAIALDVPVVYAHKATLHDARNAGLDQVTTEWVCHLDADDELEPRYFEHMADATADVRAPAVRYIEGNPKRLYRARMPRVGTHDHECVAECLVDGNWLVIGAVARTQLLRDVGGWLDFDWSEDWSMWLRCHLAGATFQPVPQAVYRAHVRYDSRNRSVSRPDRLKVHEQIARAHMPWRYEDQPA